MSDPVLYKDNVGDLYLIPSYLEMYVSDLDDLISNTTGYGNVHYPLVHAWDEIMGKYRTDVQT